MKTLIKRFIQDESGLSAVEYGLLAAGIAVAIYSVIKDIGVDLKAIYVAVEGDLSSITP